MPVHEDFRREIARQRRDEAERIAIRMGFHSAFARATAAQCVAADRARARAVASPGWVTAAWRRVTRRGHARAAAAGSVG